MPLQTRTGSEMSLQPELTLPPPFTPVRMREFGDAFDHAIALAPEKGAGTLVHVGRFDLAEFALVLEPEEPLRSARRAHYAGMAALTDAVKPCPGRAGSAPMVPAAICTFWARTASSASAALSL